MTLRYFLRTAVLATGALLQLLGAPGFAQTPTASDLTGLGLGLGVSTSVDLSRQGHVVQAVADANRIVRIQQTSDVTVGFVLEAHYFFAQGDLGALPGGVAPNWKRPWGTGPFVAIELGSNSGSTSNNPISAYALGWMVGFQEPGTTKITGGRPLSWNFGLGLRVDPNAQVLGDGLVANQFLPPNDQIRYKTSPRYGLMVLSSFGF